jgi:trimethylamine-N-oxide reductase (cytochrome c)
MVIFAKRGSGLRRNSSTGLSRYGHGGTMVKAWRNLETFIVHDFQWTATARHADIVLPATTSYERNDIEQIGDYSPSYILAMKKVIEPVFEARNDYDIFAAIADRLGKGDAFTTLSTPSAI